MKFLSLVSLLSILFISGFGCNEKNNPPIRVAYASWLNKLIPPLQNNYNASVILVNIFQPLLDLDEAGVFVPVGAESWDISSDFKVFKFKINTKNRFSDGSYLNASDYKRSWEEGLKMKASAHNHSLSDVLYKVKGYNTFKKSGQLPGLIVRGDDELEIHFETPFRRGLDEIRGARFAAYKKIKGKYIGSGPYQMDSQSDQRVLLTPNEYYHGEGGQTPLELVVIKTRNAVEALIKGEIDIFVGARSHSSFSSLPPKSPLKIIFGQFTTHSTLAINGLKNRFFSDRRLRLGFQALVAKIVKEMNGSPKEAPDFREDMQFYLPFQAGRLDSKVASHLIELGEKEIDYFMKKNQKTPLFFVHGDRDLFIFEKLKQRGVKFTPDSGTFKHSKLDFWKEVKGAFRTDVMSSLFSINHGDPDGVYHRLGQHGAIHTASIFRESVSSLLDEGRKIYESDDIDSFYKKVSQEIIREVPMVHIGFFRSVVIYNSKKVQPSRNILRRNDSYLNGFKINDH